MKKPIIILIVLMLVIGVGYLSELIFGQPVTPSGRIHFINLFDVPATYENQALKGVRVNTAMDALEFFTLSLGDFDNQTAWRIFYSNTDGDITELVLGTNGQYLKSNGASSAPSWSTIAGGGDLLADGTVPLTANWDVGNFDITLKSLTGDGTIEGATLTEGGQAVWNATETDILDSGHYIAGSIDAEHLAGDIIDETKIADDGLDSEHYNNGSIDLVHLATGVYAKDLVTTAPITGAADNIFVGADSDVTVALDFTAAWDFGGAASVEIPNGTDPDVDAAGEISNDTDGANETGDVIIRAFDGANQFPAGRKLKTLSFTLIEPDQIDAADLIPVWHNTSGMTFTIIEWKAWSDDDDVSLEIEELTDQTDYTAITTVDAVEIATDGTGVFYASDATITHAAIEHDHSIAIDFDATDTPDYVQISIIGWFNADVN